MHADTSAIWSYIFWAVLTNILNDTDHVIVTYNSKARNIVVKYRGGSRIWSGGAPDRYRPKLLTVHSSIWRVKRALFSVGSGACLRALEALGYFITKYAFSPFWGTFLYYFWNNKYYYFLINCPDKLFCTQVYTRSRITWTRLYRIIAYFEGHLPHQKSLH